jgi:Zn-dependent protease
MFSVIIHEVAHGYAALRYGDRTALVAGRLTLNPLKHLEWFGSVILPLMLLLSGTNFLVGWAKPVPYNPRNFVNERKGTLAVALAGVVANICIALIFGVFIRAAVHFGFATEGLISFASIIVFTNLVLTIFNLVPIPPLDGSKVLFALLPHHYQQFRETFERYSIPLLIFFIFFLWKFMTPAIVILFSLFTGLSI